MKMKKMSESKAGFLCLHGRRTEWLMRSDVLATDVDNLSRSLGCRYSVLEQSTLYMAFCLPAFCVAAKISFIPAAASDHAMGGKGTRLGDLACNSGSPFTV